MLLTSALAGLSFPTVAQGVAGSLDPSFGDGGIVLGPPSQWAVAYAVATQPDGKILVGGTTGSEAILFRFNANGSLDSTFGNAGIVLPPEGRGMPVRSIIVAPEGKIVAGGGNRLWRMHANGSPDPSFDGDGMARTLVGRGPLSALAVRADGRLVSVGGPADGTFSVQGHLADGTSDASFGSGGVVSTPVGTGAFGDATAGVALPDGKVVVGGWATSENGTQVFALVQYSADGSLDTAFGAGGIVLTSFRAPGPVELSGLVRQPGGKLIAAGSAPGETGFQRFTLARYNHNGELDPAFGRNGLSQPQFGNGRTAEARGLALQPDGKLVVVGSEYDVVQDPYSRYHFAVARYAPDGSLDASFGSRGAATTPIGKDHAASAQAVALQPDGKIIAAGFFVEYPGPNLGFAVARYLGDDAPATSVLSERKPVAAKRPVITGLRISPRKFRAARRGPPAVSARRRPPVGGTVRFSMNVASGVRFRIQRVRYVRCKRTRRCKRVRYLHGGFTHNADTGPNHLRFSGRLARKRLRPGLYRLAAVAHADGQSGKALVSFRVVR